MFFQNRNSRRSLLIEINPYQILAAGISRPDADSTVLECAAEFDSHDDAGLRAWLDTNFDKQKAWVPAICGFTPPDGLLQRESIQPRRMTEAGYFTELVKEQYKIEKPETWKLQTLSPLEGVAMPPEGTQRPALITGVSHSDVHHMQQRLLDHRLLPYRLEQGILPLLGAIADFKERRNDKRAVVVVNIQQDHTVAYILGKEGVHTPAPVRHGFASIVQSARKEFDLTDAASVRERLHLADEELLLRATKFVRAIGRDLKPLVDSYEMTTGQPVGEVYCAYLPPALSWINEPLAQVVGRAPFTMDCVEWLPTVNISSAAGIPTLGQHWLGALSLVANLPGNKPTTTPKDNAEHQGPWHIDTRLSAQLPSNDLVRRRFLTNLIAATLAACALTLAFWQFYLGRSQNDELDYWEEQISENKRQVGELALATKKLNGLTDRLDRAYGLMRQPYQVSTMIADLGRTRLPKMLIHSIEGSETGLRLSGLLREPSEQGTRTLRTYVESLRKDPAFAAYFTHIALTAVERQNETDHLDFEITFKLKPATP